MPSFTSLSKCAREYSAKVLFTDADGNQLQLSMASEQTLSLLSLVFGEGRLVFEEERVTDSDQ